MTVLLTGCGGSSVNVTTHHNDVARTGAYLAETEPTPAKVLPRGMRTKYWVSPCTGTNASRCIDGVMMTQPLYVRSVGFESGTEHRLFIATLNNRVYGLKANTGDREWVPT